MYKWRLMAEFQKTIFQMGSMHSEGVSKELFREGKATKVTTTTLLRRRLAMCPLVMSLCSYDLLMMSLITITIH